MANYASTKGLLLQRTGDQRPTIIKGVPLQHGMFKDWQPIRPCICVTEPCPCDELEDLIVWLPTVNRGKPTQKRVGSDELISYELESDERVLVEVQIPMTIAQLKKLKEWSEREHKSRETSGVPDSLSKGKPVSPATAVVAAFGVGFALGEKIDEATGLSDTISDWAAENIPWPF